MIERGNPLSAVIQVTGQASNLEECSSFLKKVDRVPSNVQFSHQEALLYVFEDNEAVIKMIIKGRSPTMRHVSRTHRVALDWLFDRINLDSKIHIKLHRHPKPTRQTFYPKEISRRDELESSFVFVQHLPFQFYRLF